jgi:predicted ArsR family transcriptional regulator
MDLPSSGADVLAQPTRARLFGLLQESRGPATTAELAARLGLHPNGVRRQLERLRVAGLVERRTAARGRGRPGDEWAVAAGASPGGERPRGYHDLASWLASVIANSPRDLRRVEDAGRKIGLELAPEGRGDPVERFRETFTVLGFRPAVESSGDRVTCKLCNCPYRDAARQNPDVVCGLHRGITAGLLEALAPRATLVAFEPHDPDRAGCLAEVSGPFDDQGSD